MKDPYRLCEYCDERVLVDRTAPDFEPYIGVSPVGEWRESDSLLLRIYSWMKLGRPIKEFYHRKCYEKLVDSHAISEGDT